MFAGNQHPHTPCQVANLEVVLSQRDSELRALRITLAEHEAALRDAEGAASQEALASLQEQLEDLEAENRDLKAELNAFDPKFFDEIEDLKHEHHMLSGRVQEYEAIIAQLSMQLGRPLPAGVGGRG